MANQERIDIIIGAKDQATKTLSKLKDSIIGIGTAYLSWQGAKEILKATIGAAAESERIYNNLRASIERHGGMWDVVRGKVEAFTTQIQRTTRFTDELAAQGLQKLIDYGMNTADAMRTMQVATDLAVGTGMDLLTATDLLGKAFKGNTATLARYGIIIDETVPKGEKFNTIMEQLNTRFGGAAQADIESAIGKWGQLSKALGEFAETLGKSFVENGAVGKGFDNLIGWVDRFTDNLKLNLNFFQLWLLQVSEVTAAWNPAAEAVNKWMREIATANDVALNFTEQGLLRSTKAVEDTTNKVVENTVAIITSRQKLSEYVVGWQMVDGQLKEVKASFLDLSDVQSNLTAEQFGDLQEYSHSWETVKAELGESTQYLIDFSPVADEVIYDLQRINGEWQLVARTSKKTVEEMIATLQNDVIASGILDAASGAFMNAINQIEIFQTRAKTVFGQIAQDFITIFIKSVTDALMRAIAKWIVMLLFFDKPANDRAAMQSGFDLAKYMSIGFFKGQKQFMGMPQVLGTGNPSAIGGMGGGQTINIHFNGPITNRDYVESDIIPVIEKAIVNKRSAIMYSRKPLTGKAQVAF